jgi:hypothetical protein
MYKIAYEHSTIPTCLSTHIAVNIYLSNNIRPYITNSQYVIPVDQL